MPTFSSLLVTTMTTESNVPTKGYISKIVGVVSPVELATERTDVKLKQMPEPSSIQSQSAHIF